MGFKKCLILMMIPLLGGCTILSREMGIEVLTPALPDLWIGFAHRITYTLVVSGLDCREEIVRSGITPGDTVCLGIPKTVNSPVVLRPCLSGAALPYAGMRSAGALFPRGLEGKSLRLSWEQGFLAEVLLDVQAYCPGMTALNTERLAAAVDAAAADTGSPWLLDRRKMLRPLVYGRFYGGFIGAAPVFPVLFPEETLGWFPGDPLLPALSVSSEEAEHDGSPGFFVQHLPSGFHRFIAPGGKRWMDVYVDEKGEYWAQFNQ